MKEKLRELFRKAMGIISNFSPTLNSKIYYFVKLHKKLDLKNPKTFNEKLMYLKLNKYGNDELVTKCADKYKVREYIEDNGCKEILNELIDVYDSVDEIDFDKLPNKFVLKCNHASGYNIICDDKSKLDIKDTKKKLKKWMKSDFWKYGSELQYRGIEKKIVCEKFLDSEDKNAIADFKIYCFNGKPKLCLICIERNLGKPKKYFVDKDWNLIPEINNLSEDEIKNFKLEKNENLNEMYEYAEKLSKPFEFVRVDFYSYKNKPVFGEMTFTPAGCLSKQYSNEASIKLGEMINIKN